MVWAGLRDLSWRFNSTTINLYNKFTIRHLKPFPTTMGLMASRICTANCIFCPIHRYKSSKEPFMSLKIAKKIADELIKENFTGQINLGENGDALLNPEFKEIFLEMGKTKGKQILVTNMKHMTKEMSTFLLKNGLQELTCNFDGSTKETYQALKTGCNFEEIRKNIHDFIDQRNAINSTCTIHIQAVPISRYLQYVEHVKSKFPYDYAAIERYWKKHVSPIDLISECTYINAWGTRNFNSKTRVKPCPYWASSICLVDTEGDVYPCCMDYKTQLTFGNVMDSTIREIWNGEKRRKFIENIAKNDFAAIGQPCLSCGQPNDDVKSYLNYLKYRVVYRRQQLAAALSSQAK
jgi:radical SAM protein with 4Fe4S-binding SPASM domain